jgi:hypothetical protein
MIDNTKVDKMLLYLFDLKPDVWIKVKSEEAKQYLIHIIENYMNTIEFNSDYTMIRKCLFNYI